MQPSLRKYRFILIMMIIGLGYGLRLAYLTRSMRFDEALNFMAYASKNIASIMADYSQPNNHIFNTLLTHFAYALFGNHPMILRMSAWIPGVLLIPLTYRITYRMMNGEIALLASGLVAVSPPLIDLSVNARGYSLQTFLTLILLWLAWRLIQRNLNRDWLLFASVSALGFLTIPTMLYPMGAIALWLLLTIWFDVSGFRRRVLLKNFVVAILLGAVLTVVLYLPAIVFSGLSGLVTDESVRPMPFGQYYTQFGDVLHSLADYVTWGTPLPLALLIGLGAITGVMSHRRLSKRSFSPFGVAFIAVILILLVQRVNPYGRTMTPLIPIYLIAAAAGLFYLLRRLTGSKLFFNLVTAGLIAVLAIYVVQSNLLFTSDDTGWAEDSQTAAIYLAHNTTASDQIFYTWPTNWTVKYYENLDRLDQIQKAKAAISHQYLYYHSDEERMRLLQSLIETDPTYARATFKMARQFDHSTLEEIDTRP